MPTIKHKKTIEVEETIDRIPTVMPALRGVGNLEQSIEAWMEEREKGDEMNDDLKTYVFEAAVEWLYGRGVWDYVRRFKS